MHPVTGLSLGRIAVGIASIAKPDMMTGAVGQGSSPLVTRWFGVREIGLGAATLLARGTARRHLIAVGIGVDAGDAAATLAGVRGGEIARPTGYSVAAVAGGAVLSGLLGLLTRTSKPA